MKVARQLLINTLSSVVPGISAKDNVEQSSCFAFNGKEVFTFNDEICCRMPLPDGFKYEGAVVAQSFLDILNKLPDDHIDISEKDGKLVVKGKGRRLTLNREEVLLPVDGVTPPGEWETLPQTFLEALQLVNQCTAKKEGDAFALQCVNVTPSKMEACDNFQLIRHEIETGFPADILIKHFTVAPIVASDSVDVSFTDAWIHFRNEVGLLTSIRRWADEFPDLDEFLAPPAESAGVTLPSGLAEAVERCEIFSKENSENDNILVRFKPNKVLFIGTGATGEFQEQKDVVYSGPNIDFYIPPKLLSELVTKYNDADVSADRLIVDTGKFRFVTSVIPKE